jgi:fibronectin-binding autotransporter adhesin
MTSRDKLRCCRMASAIGFIVGLGLLGGPFSQAQAATREFSGDGGGIGPFKLWSDPNNWYPVGVPQNGEDLRFHDVSFGVGDDPPPMINDLIDLRVRSMEFIFSMQIVNGLSLNWQLGGNEVGITDSIKHTGANESQLRINCPIKLLANASIENFDNRATGPCDLYLNGAIDLNGHNLTITVAEDDMVALSGSIAGQGNLHLHGAGGGMGGRIRLTGTNNNTFQGSITLYGAGNYGARLILEKQSANAVPGSLFVRQGALAQFSRSDQVADTATVMVYGGGKFDLNGHDDLIGNLTLSTASADTPIPIVSTAGGVLSVAGSINSLNSSVGNPPSDHSIQGRLELPSGEHTIWVDNGKLDIQAMMTGFGNFTKTGDGTLILSASNSFNSSITINEGILDVRHNRGLGDTAGSTAISNGVLTLSDVAIGEELLFVLGRSTGGDLPGSVVNVVGTASWAGQVALYTNLNIIGGDMTITGPISGEGGLGCFSGGTIQLGGSLPNTYTGLTLSRSPLLVLAKSGGARAVSGLLEVGSASGPQREVRWLASAQAPDATVKLHKTALINLNGFDDTFGPITFSGGRIETGTGLLGINGLVTANAHPGAATINGHLYLNPGYREFRVFDGDFIDDLIVEATITGPGHLQKTELGHMLLGGSNSYTGLTLVDEGILSARDTAALGAGDPGTLVAPGATLQLNGLAGGIVRERISLGGHPSDGGHLDVFGNVTLRNQFPSIYACLDVATNAGIYVGTGDTLTADGFVSGSGPWYKYGAGTLVFSNANANTYTGDTLIQTGTLELRKPNGVIAVPGNLTIGPAYNSVPAAVRAFQNGGLNANATVTVNAYSLFDLNGNNQSLNRLNLNDGGDVQTGAGTLSFPGGGPVAVGSLNLLGSQASSAFSGRIGLPPNSSLFFTVAPYAPGTIGVTDPELDVSALIPAPVENVNFERAGIYKNGAGEMRLTGNNSFNGRVDVAEGTVTVGSTTALGTTFDATYVNGSASLALINGLTITGETLRLDSTHATALHIRGGNNTWTGPIILARNSGIGVNQDWWLTASGVISGAGSLTKWGGGILSLSGSANNTYAGTTYVNEGTLVMAKTYGYQAVPGNLVVGQTDGSLTAVARHLNHDQIWGNITVNGGGLLDLNNFDEWTGVLTLNGGGDVQTGSGTIYPFTSVSVNPGNFGDPSVILGKLGLYQGTIPFTIAAGVSGATNSDCLISANILQYSANTGLQKNGAGVLRLTGTNTYTGSTTISGGTLWVDGLQAQSTVLADTGTTLQGSGTVGPIYFAGLNTRFLPGSSPGILTCGGLTPIAPASGTLQVELNGPTPGAGYDQLDVRGPVNLTGLALSASLGFGSAASNTFTLIQNDGTDAVVGTFSGLPQGKKLYIGQELFQISYTGGDGNDVVLTRLVTPPPPVLTIEDAGNNAVRLLWPTNDPPFSLQTATNLPATNWLAALPLPTVVGTNHIVTNAVAGTNQFYRLNSP